MDSIKKNFVYQSIYQITAIILPLITSPYIARVLGAERIGVYSYTYATAYYFMMFALLGIVNHGNKSIAAVRDDKDKLNQTFSELFLLHCFIAVFAIIVYYGYVFVFTSDNRTCFLIQGLWVISSFFDISWLYSGLENFKLTVIRNTVIKIAMTLSVFIFVHSQNDIWKYCLIMAGGTCLSQVVLWPFISQEVQLKKITFFDIKKHIKPMLILFIPAIAVTLYRYMDKIMLGNMTTKIQVGYYENAERAINIPVSIINSFGVVMLPRMANILAKGNEKKSKEYIGKSMELIMCLAIAMAFGMAGVATNFSVMFWGNEFMESGRLIVILSITIYPLAFANVLRMQYLIPKGENRPYVISVCIGAVINIIINFLLIPVYFDRGAAIGTIFAEFSVCVVQIIAVRKVLPVKCYLKRTLPYLGYGVGMFFIIGLVDKMIINSFVALMVQIVTGAIFYGVCCLIYFQKTNNEIALGMINQIQKKFKLK